MTIKLALTDRQKKWTLTKKVDLNSKFGVETFLIGTITTEQWQFHTRSLVQYNLQSFDTRSAQMVTLLHMNHQIHPHTGHSSQVRENERVGNFLARSFSGVQIETAFSYIGLLLGVNSAPSLSLMLKGALISFSDLIYSLGAPGWPKWTKLEVIRVPH